jgi:hypothetical protein
MHVQEHAMKTTLRSRPGALLLTAVAAAFTAPAHGQGTRGLVPDPISSRDLARISEILSLSEVQRQALDSFHQQYLAGYRTLREGEIEQLMQQTGRMWSRGMRAIAGQDLEQTRQEIRDTIDAMDRVMSRVRSLDEGLLAQLQPVLSEDQAARLPRVSQARARQRYATGATQMMGRTNQSARVDLSILCDDLALAPEARQASDPALELYEGRLTAAARDLYEASSRMFLDILDAIQEQGVNPADMEDPEARGRTWQAMTAAWMQASQKAREQAETIAQLNRRTVRELGAVLPPEAAAQLRARYVRRAYPEVPWTRQAERGFRAALRLDDLPEALRPDIVTTATLYQAQRDAIVDEAIAFVDEQRRETSPLRFGPDGFREQQRRMEEFQQRLAELDRTTLEALRAMVGAELAARIDSALTADDPQPAAGPQIFASPGPGATPPAVEEGPDPFVPRPIGRREVATYARRLGLADEERFVVQSLHDDYLDSWDRLRDTEIDALRTARATLDRARRDREAALSVAQVEEAYALAGRVLELVLALDRAFFDDLETLVRTQEGADALARLRASRQRVVYNRGVSAPGDGPGRAGGPRGPGRGPGGPGRMWRAYGESSESSVDVAAIVEGLELDDQARGGADRILAGYEARAVEAFRRQNEIVRAMWREADLRRAAERESRSDPDQQGQDAGRQRWERMRQETEAQQRALREASDPIVALNREAMEELAAALPPDPGAALRGAYSRQAFPAAYDVANAAERYLAAALQLPDLQGDQGGRLSTILNEYRPAYEQVCGQIARIHADSTAPPAGFDGEGWRRFAEQRSRLEVLTFDREELNARALRRLRDVLTPQQEARIGLPAERPSESF